MPLSGSAGHFYQKSYFFHIPVLLLWCGWVLPHSPLLGCQQPGGFIQAPEVVALIKLGVTFLVIYLALTVLW